MNKLLYILTFLITCYCFSFCTKTSSHTAFNADEKELKDALNTLIAKERDTTQLRFLAAQVNHLTTQDSLTAFLHRRAGKAFYDQALFQEAKTHYEKALALQIKVTPLDTEGVAKSYFRLGRIHHDLQNLSEAHQYYKKGVQKVQSFSLLSKLWVDPWRPYFTDEADSYAEMGDFERSLEQTQLILAQSIKFKDSVGVAQSYKRLGTTYNDMRQFTKSVGFLQKALPLLKDSFFQATTKNNLAFSYRHIGQYDKAIALLNQVVPIFKALKEEEFLADVYSELAQSHLGKGDFKAATHWSYQSLNSWLKTKPSKAVEAYRVLGDIALKQQQPDSALFAYQKALETLALTFKNKDNLNNPNIKPKTFNRKVQLMEVLARKGGPLSILYQKTHDLRYLKANFETAQLASAVAQALRRQMHADESKYFWNETALPIYKKGIATAYQLYTLTKDEKYKLAALQFSERSKAPVLQEGIADNAAKQFAGVPQQDLDCERALRASIAILEKRAEDGDKIDGQIGQARSRLYQFQDSLKQKYPNYGRYLDKLIEDTPLPKESGSAISINALQKRLADSTAVIEYAFDEDSIVYQFVITKTHFEMLKQDLPKDFNTKFKLFAQSVSNDSLIKYNYKKAQADYCAASFYLYQLLLEKPLDTVHAAQNIKQICLIVEGRLNFLPFAALTDKAVDEWQGKTFFEHLLVQKYAFSRAFSLNPLHHTVNVGYGISDVGGAEAKSETRNPKSKTFVQFQAYGIDFKEKHWKNDKKSKGELPNAEQEVYNIGQKYTSRRIYFNPNARKDSFKTHAPYSDILHITTHGYADALLLEKKDSMDTDYELSIRDISMIPLRARLTFLSACESGIGTMREGEGVLSLARSFMLSGSRSVMMTLWSIPDGSTAKIANHFYDAFQQNNRADIALQTAQLQFMSNSKSDENLIPNKWAALTFVGDVPLQTAANNWVFWALGFVAFVGCSFGFSRTRNNAFRR